MAGPNQAMPHVRTLSGLLAFALVALDFQSHAQQLHSVTREDDLVATLRQEIAKMDLAHPEADARKHIHNGDSRFLGIYGYSIDFPGTPSTVTAWKRIHDHGFRGIKGTADTVFGDEHMRLIKTASQYAERYNRYIWKHVFPKSPNET